MLQTAFKVSFQETSGASRGCTHLYVRAERESEAVNRAQQYMGEFVHTSPYFIGFYEYSVEPVSEGYLGTVFLLNND